MGLKSVFDERRDYASTSFLKALHYTVNEWEAVCCYMQTAGLRLIITLLNV